MNLADLPWRPMDSVPKDGTMIAVVAHEWNNPDKPLMAQPALWFGKGLIAVNSECSTPWADGWLTLAEFNKFVNGEDAGI